MTLVPPSLRLAAGVAGADSSHFVFRGHFVSTSGTIQPQKPHVIDLGAGL